MPLGVDESGSGACGVTNPTCNAVQAGLLPGDAAYPFAVVYKTQNALPILSPCPLCNPVPLRPRSAQPPPLWLALPLQLRSQNAINSIMPDLNPATWRPAGHAGALASYSELWDPIPAFGAWAAAVPPGPAVPPGRLANAVGADKEGAARTAQRHAPGALLPP